MSMPQPVHNEIWIERFYAERVARFEAKSVAYHWGALIIAFLFFAAQVVLILVDPPWLANLTYTPMLWVFGLLSYLIVAPVLRYSKVLRWYPEMRTNEDLHMKHWAQHLVVFLTFVALLVEIYGIWTGNFTISAVTRDFVDANTEFYWVFGLLAGVLAGLIVDLKSLPELIKLCCVTWVAVLAHICWWIS